MQKLHSPVLVFGGPYSNLKALEALYQKAGQLGIAPDHCFCTGDVVAYCAHPGETVDLLREWGCHVIMGNCEESLGYDKPDCGCGFDEGTACDLEAGKWYSFANSKLNAMQRNWMRMLPRYLEIQTGQGVCRLVHGGVTRINRFLFASSDRQQFEEEFAHARQQNSQVNIIIGGHCGLPFARYIGDFLWVNAGVIGMPANDGTPDGWYMVIETLADNRLQFNFLRLAYDFRSESRAMQKNDLSLAYAAALEYGRWPALDILERDERKQTGYPLAPKAVLFPQSSSRGV